ncbi:hypothetical protein CONCODRAFT_170995 [Conidiobolus coronatus NRRL 28638]|uniref:Uncharacterized protein n=1 Tax=Conidiobolus coronatus (strain ATCC 28846 / CBS 209.66 / NRRL 28638) TaxID=796925 RepID=A0A137P516_CONC2|nr:hypothetical protein CONCODRAFT_170995 [Conidiobolus coronatus NRRL 28638]|eukprot:KXN70098.1 hypothetical protein CONCODRAFT_170995 [Conidiobolus coronatus NRRL 28638]
MYNKLTIKRFIEEQGYNYVAGKAYYELVKPEIMDPSKKGVILEKIETGERITGRDIYSYLNLSDKKTRQDPIDPEARKEFRIYIQSKSYNRVLVHEEHLLYNVQGMTKNVASSSEFKDSDEKIKRLLEHIPSMEIAIIAHGDYCDENSTYLLKKLDFTRDPAVICNFVTNVGHTGGGDFDEAYEYVMRIARTDFTWRENTNKGFVLIGDATPHLPSYKQNPLKIDWKEEAKLLRDNGIKIYAVRCLNWNEAKHFYKELASLTCGHYLELSQFQAIPSWLIAISYREAGDYERLELFEEEIKGRSGTMNRNFHQLFSTLAGGQNAFEEENSNQDHENDNELNPVDPGRFQVLDIRWVLDFDAA